MEYNWIETTHEVYRAIYDQHKDDFNCFSSYTNMGHDGERLLAQVTEWCFEYSEHPIIRSQLNNFDEWSYYILKEVYND